MKFIFIRGPIDFRKKSLLFIMKTFIFLSCALTFGFNSKTSFSQNVKINIKNNQEISVIDVFELIKKETDYRFVYKTKDFKNAPKVTLKKGIITAHNLLTKSLSFGRFTYALTADKRIVLKQGAAINKAIYQQTIKGSVKDIAGIPLAGTHIIVSNSEGVILTGTSSNFDGDFTIRASKGNVVKFSYVGFLTQVVKIKDQQEINVVLKENANTLDEIVLNTGYQKISKERATGSFEQLDNKVLGIKTSQNIFNKIEGEVAGVLFDAGDGATIRGVSTINSVNDPLVVVDGFPIEQGIETINPNDVESITILKDAAAASIWGIRAANGVIVIVTRKGTKNAKPTVSYSTSFSMTNKLDLHDQPYASTESFLEFEKHMADNEWRTLPNSFNSSNISKGLETYLSLNEGVINNDEANAIINNLKNIDSRGQFEDLFISNQTWLQHNLSIGGGGENSSYRASLLYNQNKNNGSFKNNNSNQIVANISNHIKLSPKFTFTSRVNYSETRSGNNGMSLANASGLDQYQNIIDENGDRLTQSQGFYQEFKDARSVDNGYPYNWDYNLQQEAENKNNSITNTQIRLQAALNYKITDHISFEGRYQYEKGTYQARNLYNENTFQVRNQVNIYTTNTGTDDAIASAIPAGSMLDLNIYNSESQSGRLQLNYNQSFKNNLHNVSVIGGYEARKVLSDSNANRLYGYDDRSLNFASNINFADRFPTVYYFGQNQIPNYASITENENRYISYYGNFAYTYDKKYTITGSTRLDDANLFGASDKYKNIPLYSIGAKWSIHNENFFKSNTINNLSLRATYGSNGNVNNSTSPFVQVGISNDPYTGNDYGFISNVKNPELRLEKVYVTNLGVDFGMFNNRLNGSVEYYQRKSEDLLSNVIFPSILGFNSALINAGAMENKGVDISLRGLVVNKKDFKYNTTLNFSYNKNTVTEVEVPEDTPFAYTRLRSPLKNKPLRYLYSYQFEGLNEEGAPMFLNENGELVNRDIDVVEALKYEGTTTPKVYGGWINQFSYKGFTLRALTSFKLGHVFRNTNFMDYANLPNTFSGNHYIHKDFESRWQNPGDETTTNIPKIPTTRTDATLDTYQTYYRYGSQHVDDASHIRLREVVLGYQLDDKITRSAGFNSLYVSFQATNLALINFNKWNVDPESLIFKIRPTFTLSLNANF
ncbi:SusC/RagA family TonB-linked outer membrane protein [Polaribacter sp. Q13]|uniref:SusC/RagA family TonB-linked outer membrane protein n=1 Tax=Polaribacter sp. Q13 TaxID=2806551 RepID=UPI00193C6CF2|nr:SusC/RagA family TonB-linked outer membrane protein [Polaribacter sp. Q13]QVY65009.1 SusC/RagA family TonB-linked outer membrane protein [Polaribacter sp. Q13]